MNDPSVDDRVDDLAAMTWEAALLRQSPDVVDVCRRSAADLRETTETARARPALSRALLARVPGRAVNGPPGMKKTRQ